jgi:hypothetical protein
MGTFLYRCPRTSRNVQGWVADDPATSRDTYRSVDCPACGLVHLVNPESGKTIGGEDE